MHVPMPVHAEVGGVLLSSSIVVIFKSLPPNLEFVILARLSGQRTFTLLVLRYHVCPTVMWTLGVATQVCMLGQQALHLLPSLNLYTVISLVISLK